MAGISLSACFVALVLVLLVCCKVEGREKEITVRSSSDCRSYDLDDYSEINIHYEGDTLFGECEIEIDADEDYPRICIEAEKLFFDSCAAEIEVHAGFVTSSSDKDYSCSSSSISNSEYCSYLDSLTVVIKEHGYSSTDIKLRVYPGRSEFDIDFGDIAETAVIGVYVIVGIVIGAIVLLVIIVIIVVCCCCNKRRAASGTVYRNQQPAAQPPQGTYPQVQYQAAPQTAGYQPPPQGYQPPPQGYQPPPQGYQPPPQGYQSAPQGYSGPPPEQGFQMAGYQQKPSAPPPEKDAFAPPPYPGN